MKRPNAASTLLAALLACAPLAAAAAVSTTDTTPADNVVAYRGSVTLKTSTGATARFADVAACRAAIEADAETRRVSGSYRCVETVSLRVVWTAAPPPPPPPVDTDGDGVQDASDACPTVAASTADGCPVVVPPPPTGDAYSLYPALNLAEIPWHAGAGAWGPQVRLQAPALPVTTRSVSVSSLSAFNQAAAVAGTRITITAGWAGNTVATINASDVDVVIPQGVAIGAVEIGAWPRSTPIARVRISGGGRMGQYRDFAGVSDVVLDGIDMNGDSGFGGGETNHVFRAEATRLAVLNVRAIAPGYIWLGSAKHVVIANSNLFHGAAARSAVGYVEGWGIRNTGGPITIVDSRIQGTRYHNIRAQSVGGEGELLYITRSTIVAQAEGRTAWLWNNLGTGARGDGAVLERNEIYTYAAPGCGFGTEISSADVAWSRIANNRFFGAGAAVFSSVSANGGGTEGNTFAALTALPPWGGRGDPRQIPLPNGWAVIAGEGSCPGF